LAQSRTKLLRVAMDARDRLPCGLRARGDQEAVARLQAEAEAELAAIVSSVKTALDKLGK
jgi:hypothetical protein